MFRKMFIPSLLIILVAGALVVTTTLAVAEIIAPSHFTDVVPVNNINNNVNTGTIKLSFLNSSISTQLSPTGIAPGHIYDTFIGLQNTGTLPGILNLSISNVTSALGVPPFVSKFPETTANLQNILQMAIWIDTVGGHTSPQTGDILLNVNNGVPTVSTASSNVPLASLNYQYLNTYDTLVWRPIANIDINTIYYIHYMLQLAPNTPNINKYQGESTSFLAQYTLTST